ncbi:MAG TPA: hypothetical protein VNR88_05960 [Hyphomicrobium sp.]|nr:hypothetical protein [Hyphomicrobium sp.]
MVEAIVCDALHCHLNDSTISVAVSLGRQQRSRYEPRPYEPMKELLTRLGPEGIGALTVEWGVRPEKGKGRRTTFAASPRLVQLASGLSFADFGRRSGGEPIILRNTKTTVARHQSEELPDPFDTYAQTGAMLNELISYTDDDVSNALRAEMHDINEALDNADLSLSVSLSGRVDVGDRWLRRMFNNGRKDFCHGGRLAGGFWMDLPKEVRRTALTIGGDAVAEVDYAAMMPRLLYAHLGATFPPEVDPYAIEGIPPKHREGIKSLFAALLYGPSALKKWPRGVAQKFPPRSSLDTMIGHIKAQHPVVTECFGTMVGFELMRTESDILVAVMRSCFAEGMTVLPIHDAVLCPASATDRVATIMLKVFESRTGMQGVVKKQAPSVETLLVD